LLKVGIAGVPSQEILDRYVRDQIVDLDMPLDGIDYFDVIEKVSPKI
jgi:hypothetical protein